MSDPPDPWTFFWGGVADSDEVGFRVLNSTAKVKSGTSALLNHVISKIKPNETTIDAAVWRSWTRPSFPINKNLNLIFFYDVILLMEEMLHHSGCIKPGKQWDQLPINWCRMSSINSNIPMYTDVSGFSV